MKFRTLATLAGLAFALSVPQFAGAAIIAIDGSQTNPNHCGSGGIVCNGSNPFLLSTVLSGSTPLTIAPNTTPTFLVKNDLGNLTTLTLLFSGSLASNGNINCQVTGWSANTLPFGTNNCTVNGLVGSGANGVTPDTLIFSQGNNSVGLSANEIFGIRTASFAHAGQDFGNITGGGTVPEPASLGIVGIGLLFAASRLRRRISA